MRCTAGAARERLPRLLESSPVESSFVCDVDADAGPAADDDDDAAAAAAPDVFFDCRAEVKMPSGTTRSRSHGIVSIVFRLPSVDFVKYASGDGRSDRSRQSVVRRRVSDSLRCHFRGFLFTSFLSPLPAALVLDMLSAALALDGPSSWLTSSRRTEYVCLMYMSRSPSRRTWFSRLLYA